MAEGRKGNCVRTALAATGLLLLAGCQEERPTAAAAKGTGGNAVDLTDARSNPAAEEAPPCTPGLDDVHGAPRFAAYPAQPRRMRFAGLDLRNPIARTYRTVLREGARAGPNFAGHYTIVQWGCGSSCSSWAIVDNRTGQVHQPPAEIAMLFFQTNIRDPGLHYRRDSRLLAVAGGTIRLRGEGVSPDQYEGISYLRWNGHSLRPVRLVAMDELCRTQRPAVAQPRNS